MEILKKKKGPLSQLGREENAFPISFFGIFLFPTLEYLAYYLMIFLFW